MSTVAVFLNTEQAFDTTWHLGFLHKLPNLKFSVSLIKDYYIPSFPEKITSFGRR
jgi:hypothetical protein